MMASKNFTNNGNGGEESVTIQITKNNQAMALTQRSQLTQISLYVCALPAVAGKSAACLKAFSVTTFVEA